MPRPAAFSPHHIPHEQGRTDSQPAACSRLTASRCIPLLPLRYSRNLMNGAKLTRYLVIRNLLARKLVLTGTERPSRCRVQAMCRFGCKHDETRNGVFQLFSPSPPSSPKTRLQLRVQAMCLYGRSQTKNTGGKCRSRQFDFPDTGSVAERTLYQHSPMR